MMDESGVLRLLMEDIGVWKSAWELYDKNELKIKPKDREEFIAWMLEAYSITLK